MFWKKSIVVVLIAALIPCYFQVPSTQALQNLKMTINPNFTGTNAEYSFLFTIEKKLKIRQWIQLKFPDGFFFPEEPPVVPDYDPFVLEPWEDMEWDPTDKTIKVKINIELNPEVEGYSDIQITIPQFFGIRNPDKPGEHTFGIRTEAEPDWVYSEPVEIVEGVATSFMHRCEFTPASKTAEIIEKTSKWNKTIQLHHEGLQSSVSEKAYYISVEDLTLAPFGFSLQTIEKEETVQYLWTDRTRKEVTFSATVSDHPPVISPAKVNGVETQWSAPPVLTGETIYINYFDFVTFFSYKTFVDPTTNVLHVRDYFGKDFWFNKSTHAVQIDQTQEFYTYEYELLSSPEFINNTIRVDIHFFLYKYLDSVEWTELEIRPNILHIHCTGIDRYKNKWEFSFIRDVSPNNEHYQELVLLEINEQPFLWEPIWLDSKEVISADNKRGSLLIPIANFAEAIWLNTYEDPKTHRTIIYFRD